MVSLFVRQPKPLRRAVHTLVAEAFLGPAEGHWVKPIDGNYRNCRKSNLTYVTREHGYAARRNIQGETNGQAKLKAWQVRQIRSLRTEDRHSLNGLARKFGVTRRVIRRICNGDAWVSVT